MAEKDSDLSSEIKQKTKEVEANKKAAAKEEEAQVQAKATGNATPTTTTTDLSGQVKDFANGFNLANPSWDAFVILFFLVASVLYGFSLGRDRIIVILVSIYMALAVVHAVPDFVLNVKLNESFAFQITTFISVFVILFFLISRWALLRTLGANAVSGKWYQTIIFSFLHVGLLLSIAMSFLPPNMLDKFAPLTQTIFTHEWGQFAWIAAPVVAMVIFGSKAKEA